MTLGKTASSVRFEGVTKAFGEVVAVRDISFTIEPGTLVTLLGPSGCGKSTFIRCLNRMNDTIDGCVVSGRVTLDGHDIYAPGVDVVDLRARIGGSLQTLALGGAALNPDWPPILQAIGIRAEVGYGLTEASPVVSTGYAEECPPGSVGQLLPTVEVRIGAGEELLLRGPMVTRGYYGDTAATEESFADGWLRTGDRGRVDENGFLYITGRIKEAMVTTAGETIYPEEIEPCYASPLFAEWCVAPRVSADGNDLPTLFVVPAEGVQNGSAVDKAFVELRNNAPPRLRADAVICLEQPLPRTLTGKVRRRFLAKQFNNKKAEE